ncbi:FUSC family protein [Streptomyces yaizuensis]|uniref:FUSC family protein n=1 Tax=Streptomyces yaizuensis TaxID=2989713 RepID=A0ABQ5NYF6_9ACTN|nr:FUSC family protein [Streptomyces sp. YSPA8]GLF95388.1 FUSC family protein [Streptomyces sp. YSPA8]
MLTGMFVAPDPGRLRLRAATRAVLGIALAVLGCALAGQPLPAVVTGGLAALLALFTVTDATVRAQALTTALLPAAGVPVLALAALLHDLPLARDAAFLAVAVAAVYARRFGPRGHSVGVFAFMSFFVAQFLGTVPGDLPALWLSLGIGLLAAASVRFGLWCYERGLPPAPVPALPQVPGPLRVTTRQSLQVALAGALALGLGQLLSEERWYWAVGAAWWSFVNTTSRGETLVRGGRRVLGTVAGVAAGVLVAAPAHGSTPAAAVLSAVCVFGIFYTAAVSYTWMMFFVTVLVTLLYGLLGALDGPLLLLRVAETGLGALCAAVAVALVLPVTTHATTDAWVRQAVVCVHRCTAEAAARLTGSTTADPAGAVAELEALLGRVRLSLAPLVHPFSPLRARKARARQVLALLDVCAREVRGLASVAADPVASQDARLAAACRRVEAAVEALVPPLARLPEPRTAAAPAGAHPAAEAALGHLHALERALAELAAPLLSPPRAPLAPA